MSILFDVHWNGPGSADRHDYRPRPSGLARLLIAFGLIAAVIGALDRTARGAGDAPAVAPYSSTQNGDQR